MVRHEKRIQTTQVTIFCNPGGKRSFIWKRSTRNFILGVGHESWQAKLPHHLQVTTCICSRVKTLNSPAIVMTIPQYGKLTNVLHVTHMIAFIDIYKLAHNCGTAFHPLFFFHTIVPTSRTAQSCGGSFKKIGNYRRGELF